MFSVIWTSAADAKLSDIYSSSFTTAMSVFPAVHETPFGSDAGNEQRAYLTLTKANTGLFICVHRANSTGQTCFSEHTVLPLRKAQYE